MSRRSEPAPITGPFSSCPRAGAGTELGKDLLDDLAVHVGQPEVAAGVAIDQPRVVDPHQVQDRGVIIVHVHGVGHDVDAVLVGLAVGQSSFDARRRPAAPRTPWRSGCGPSCLGPSVQGVRPNSVQMATSVWSEQPALL